MWVWMREGRHTHTSHRPQNGSRCLLFLGRERERDAPEPPQNSPELPRFCPLPEPFPLASCVAGAGYASAPVPVPTPGPAGGRHLPPAPGTPCQQRTVPPRNLRKVFRVEKKKKIPLLECLGEVGEMPPRPWWSNHDVDPEAPKLTPCEHPWAPSGARCATPSAPRWGKKKTLQG